MEYDKRPMCPIVDVDGFIEAGKQFDLDITLPEDNRNVIFGVVKDCYKEPIKDAVVKLIEIVKECGKEEARPVSHTFTDDDGTFVFGPLCPNRNYKIQIWVDQVKHVKICVKGKRDQKCLKGKKIDCCDFDYKPEKPWDECWKKEEEHCEKEKHCDKCCKKEEHCEKEKPCDECFKKEEHCEKEKSPNGYYKMR